VGAALEGGFDLGALALCFVALALLVAAKQLAQAIAGPLNFSLFGVRPLHGVAVAIENGIVGTLDDAIRGVEKLAAGFISGLIDSFGLLIAIPALLVLGVKAALEYLWNHALQPLIRSIVATVKTTAENALAKAVALEGTVAANLAAAERYAREHATAALNTAEDYVDRKVSSAIATLRGDIADGVSRAEAFAETAVGKLRAAEDSAIATAVGLAAAARVAGELAAANALNEAERAAGSALAQSEAAAAEALARAQAAGQAALDGVRGIAVGAADDLATIEGQLGALGTAGLIAAIPALGTLVHAIATEAGLENAECRSKVKGICGTDANAWANLLGGLAAIGFAFSLRELYEVAEPLAKELAPVIAKAA
jgi:hypothetical protein